jgi:hypothetical protein
MRFGFLSSLAAAVLVAGCNTTQTGQDAKPARGRDGTIAYQVQVESNEPGVRIEADNDYVGVTPLTLTVFGDKDGTFHNFGSPHYVIRALPVKPGQRLQTKIFRTGGWFAAEDSIPRRVFFDMSLPEDSGTGASPAPRY